MARSIQEIQQNIIESITSDENLVALNSTSKTAIWRLFAYITAYTIWTLESLFDILKTDVDATIKELKPHSERWYASKAKMYQHGFNLLPDSDVYDNSTRSTDEIEQSKVVQYSAVQEQITENGRLELRIKLAGADGAELHALTSEQLTGVKEYFKRIKDAGVPLNITSDTSDGLRMQLNIYYDPLILNGEGSRLDGQNNRPIQEAMVNYLKNLPFNGWFVPQYAEDVVQQVEGVVICKIINVETKYGNKNYTTLTAEKYNPDAGYLTFLNGTDDIRTSDLKLNFIPQSAIK